MHFRGGNREAVLDLYQLQNHQRRNFEIRKVIERIKAILREQLEQVIEETVKRSILRDSFSNQLDEKDLLSVVESISLVIIKKWAQNTRLRSGIT
jgi:hypothetical protein